jgi:hypothetical protein
LNHPAFSARVVAFKRRSINTRLQETVEIVS